MPIGSAALLSCKSRSNAARDSSSAVVMAVFMGVTVTRASSRLVVSVGARFGLERRRKGGHFEPELAQEPVEHVIVLVEQAPCIDLQSDVAVAQVIGSSQE